MPCISSGSSRRRGYGRDPLARSFHSPNNGRMTGTLRAWLLFQLAKLHTFIGLRDRAVRSLRFALAEQPGLAAAWRHLAFLLAASGPRDAEDAFLKAIRLDPSHAATRFNYGFMLHEENRLEDAEAQFLEAIRLSPTLDRAWYGLGLINIKRNEFLLATERLTQAAKLQYHNPYAGYYLAFAYHKLGEHEKANREYRRVRNFDPRMATQMERDFGVTDG
jgi:Tfp pilus assembly protein PilF